MDATVDYLDDLKTDLFIKVTCSLIPSRSSQYPNFCLWKLLKDKLKGFCADALILKPRVNPHAPEPRVVLVQERDRRECDNSAALSPDVALAGKTILHVRFDDGLDVEGVRALPRDAGDLADVFRPVLLKHSASLSPRARRGVSREDREMSRIPST